LTMLAGGSTWIACPVCAAALLVAGCGGGSKTAESFRASPKTIVVEETEFRISPSALQVPELGIYVFKAVNRGTIPHVLEFEGPGIETETEPIAPGRSAKLRLYLRKPGKFELYCPLDHHKAKGMVAQVIVGGG
jgi:plastocyanin